MNARLYPLGMVRDESCLIVERVNANSITQATLMLHAVHGILSKSSHRHFQDLIAKLNLEAKCMDKKNTGDTIVE